MAEVNLRGNLRGQMTWGWRIAAYLFLAGAGSGSYAAAVGMDLLGSENAVIIPAGITMGVSLVLLGSLFLIWDLGTPIRFLRAATRANSSWLARGFYIILLFLILGLVNIAVWMYGTAELRFMVGTVNLILAFAVMIYTGLLLGANKSIPLWANPLLPLLFMLSSLSTGIMGIGFLSIFFGSLEGSFSVGTSTVSRTQIEMVLLSLEALAVYLLLQGVRSTVGGRASVRAITNGVLRYRFWLGVIVLGLAVPMLIGAVAMAGAVTASPFYTGVGSVSGLVGGFLLRNVILAGGVREPLQVSGMFVKQPVEFHSSRRRPTTAVFGKFSTHP